MAYVTTPKAGKKGPDAGHGNRFQSKLLMLYAVQAINLDYQFYLGTELSVGEKFDDLIFHFRTNEESDGGTKQTFHQQYLQAKHRLNEKTSITADHLINEDTGDFSLLKYFQSYVKIRSRGNDIENCIICTNIDFNHQDLQRNSITLAKLEKENWPKMLDCKDVKKGQTCYKLKVPISNYISKATVKKRLSERMKTWVMNCTVEDMKFLFKLCTDKNIKHLFRNCTDNIKGKQFSDYTADEIKDVFNNFKDKKELQNFFKICGEGIVAGVFNGFLSFFDYFLDKLIFSVKTPNEDELDSILAKEVGKHFLLSNNVLPSAYIMNEMVNWFKQTDHHWFTPEKAKEIINGKAGELMALCDTTAISVDYQKQLSKNLEFNDASIDQLVQELNSFWDNSEMIMYINSKTPKLTAVKVILAITKLNNFFPNKDDYLVISSQRLQEYKEPLELALKVEMALLFVVVDESISPQIDLDCGNLISKGNGKKKIILISSKNFNKEKSFEDSITVEVLSEKTKNFLKSKQVSFQGIVHTVSDLIELNKAKEVIDSTLIENLLQMADDNKIQIPSFPCSNFEEFSYINRHVAFPLTDVLIKKLARKMNCTVEELKGKCRVDSNGRIQWHVQDKDEKEKLWKGIGEILKEIDSSDSSSFATLPDEQLIDPNNKKRVIIMGVAGTGKSTILSHYYKEIKKTNSDWWVIKISLVDHTRELQKIDSKEDAKNFFIKATGIDRNPFARLLLYHRLKTGDRIVMMLDGFDEIDTKCQNKVIQLVENVNKSISLYITTRPHMTDQLQFELSQLAYSLVKFTEEDQINYLTSIWTAYSTKEKVDYDEMTIRSFATKLIEQIAETLNDKEKEFIGIPLQCRILAECFQSKIITANPLEDFSQLLEGRQYDLANLYRSLMEEKRRVFREEKIKINSADNHIAIESIEKSIRKTEDHLRNLAIQTIVEEQEYVDILIPSTSFKSEIERKKKKIELNEFGIRFGLLYKKHEGNLVEFLHRTYAEYLVADFIYTGFLLDDERHNNLLEKEFIREWIVKKLLVENKYNGVRVFFDSMLKEIFDNENWKNRIKQRILSDRLQKFTSLFYDQRFEKNWALCVAFWGRNANIILFIFDCLDVHLSSSDILSVIIREINVELTPAEMRSIIRHNYNVRDLFNQRTEVFQRILNYFNDADNKQLEEILKTLCSDDFWRRSTALELKQENVKRNVVHFLDFMESHREKVKFVLDYVHIAQHSFLFYTNYSDMPIFVMRHGDDDLMKKYITRMSSVFPDDRDFTRFMKKIIHEYLKKEDWQIGRIEKMLITLRDIIIDVMPELSRFVLVRCSQIIQQDENINHRSSLEEMGMTGLYGMAFRGDLKSFEREIEKEIGCPLENPETYSEKLLRLMLNDDTLERNKNEDEREGITVSPFIVADFIEVTPFEVAAAYGHEEICTKIFLQGMNDNNIKKLLRDAIWYYRNVVMVWTILKSVKAVWDKEAFIELLKPLFRDYFYTTTEEKQIFVAMFCVVAEDKENGYRDVNELVLQGDDSIETLKLVPSSEILQGMISEVGGLDNWMNRLMNTDIYRAFKVLESDGFLEKLDQEHQIPQMIDILIKLRPSLKKEGTTISYWSKSAKGTSEKFIEVVAKQFSEEDLKRLLFARDENNMVVFFRILIRKGRDWIETILSNLPGNLKKEVEDLFEKETPQLIDQFFSSSTFLATLYGGKLLDVIEFYLKNGNEKQLSKFSQVVKVLKLEKTLRREASRGRERCKEFVELLKEKLDCNTVAIYNSLIEEYSAEFNSKERG